MLCPAAVSAAAAAVWLLAALGPGLSPAAAAEDDSEPGFTPCSRCFYRQTPPRGASAAPWLRPLCHRLPGGRAFATLSRPTCDTAVYSAYRLGRGWTEEEEGEDGEGGELVTDEDEDSVKAAVPALLRRGEDDSDSVSPEDSPVELWDSAVKTLVQSSISPQCGTLGGDLYILSGAGGPGAAEDEDAGCQTGPLWSAVCCDVPEGDGGFSVGMISDEGGERQVSVAELVEILGVPELFSEGCGGTDKAAAAITLGLFSKEYPENVRKTEGDAEDEGDDADSGSWFTFRDRNEYAQESTGVSTSEEQAAHVDAQSGESDDAEEKTQKSYAADVQSGESDDAEEKTQKSYAADAQSGESDDAEEKTQKYYAADAQSGESDDTDVAQKSSSGSSTSESRRDTQQDDARSRAEWSKSPESSGDKETVEEEERNATSSSTVVYILSTTMSVLKAPLRPIFSRITSFPGQVLYVLQEDLGVLSALPGDTFNLFHLLTSDCLSYMRSAAETLYGIGDRCFCNVYHCTSSMAGELLNSCHTGVTGVGTLAGDTLGIFGGALDNAWWVTKLCGGRLWEWSSGYVGTVASEMGGQTQAVGGGFFRLLWSSGGTVGKILGLIGGIIFGVLDIIFGAFRIAFGRDNEE
ncbi:uncharacterized protein LOC115396981 [Salarias fasciatus]|uniref:uncharacterized protein LOC115396981 n=1 Tax=Salarias fasciatus TaxID=181472 RepID=UPI001176A8CD|nr:uncharacterized protein LOC115396981 [Salarias fasciatus]